MKMDDETVAVTAAVATLTEAMDEAEQYLDTDAAFADGVQIHHDYIQEALQELEKLIQTQNKKNRTNPTPIPPEVKTATVMMKRLAVRRVALQQAEKKADHERQLVLHKPTTKEPEKNMQITVSKTPLPQLEIPKFSGNPLEYRNFIAIFNNTVHSNQSLLDSQRLAYLKQYVTGDAERLIGTLPITDSNYKIATDLMQENYGNDEQNIATLYEKIRTLPKAKNEPPALRELYNESEAVIRMLEQAGQDVNSNSYLYDEVLKKYPFEFLMHVWTRDDMTFKEFREAAGQKVRLWIRLAQRTESKTTTQYNGSSGAPKTQAGKNAVPLMTLNPQGEPGAAKQRRPREPQKQTESGPFCVLCHVNGHFTDECTRYVTIGQRLDALKDRCTKCLKKIHPAAPCLRDIPCYHCTSLEHHRALCPTKHADGTTLLTKEEIIEQKPGKFLTFMAVGENPKTGTTERLRICLDPGSDQTLISKDAASRLQLNVEENEFKQPIGLGGVKLPKTTRSTRIVTLLSDSNEAIMINGRVTESIAGNLTVANVENFKKRFPRHADVVIPETGEGKQVDILIGTDMATRIVTLQKCIYVDANNQLLSTKFGYLILQGSENPPLDEENEETVLLSAMETELKSMWDLDVIGLKHAEEKQSVMEERALQKFYQTVEFINGRYNISWPWRHYPPNLSRNYGMALGRLKSLERKLRKSNGLLQAYDTIITEQLQQDIIEEVPNTEIRSDKLTHYIPHHAVIELEKSTPVRVVYDASSTTKGFDSLNASILKGTNWTGDLVASLIRFRKNPNAVVADIKRAFHQIVIKAEDRDVMRFLWIRDISKPLTEDNIKVYRFKRMAFGIIASPFLLYAVVQNHLKKYSTEVSEILSREMYADNLVVSLPRTIEPEKFYEETRNIFKAMSMDMIKWTSNNAEFRKAIPPSDGIPDSRTTVLGMTWDTKTDIMGVKSCKIAHLNGRIPTKRLALKIMASLFDPIGCAIPVAVAARVFLRELWKRGYKWETEIEGELLEKWNTIKQSIEQASAIQIPRTYFTYGVDEADSIQMHTFVDASKQAYAAVSYLRVTKKGGSQTAFVMARARLAPQTDLSVPRLELIAAVVGSRLETFLDHQLQLKQKIEHYIWSDSKCILAWLETTKILPAAIQKQIREISAANVDHFRYVPSSMNPADIASRGATLEELQQAEWNRGPSWLRNSGTWPPEETTCEHKEHDVTLLTALQPTEEANKKRAEPLGLVLQNYSLLTTLLRKTAIRFWAFNTITGNKIRSEMKYDYAKAKQIWIRYVQDTQFPHLQDLAENKATRYNGIMVFRDENRILRYQPRLANANIPEESRTPIILPKKSHLTKLIVLQIHAANMHSGTAHTLAQFRQNYYMPQARREIFHIITNGCMRCRRNSAKPYKMPVTPPLPAFRVNKTSAPFKNVGIDVFGPMQVNSDRKGEPPKKKWVILFTCLVVRAVHLEVLHQMKTVDIISAIRRFVARRGAPEVILTDNAPQFTLVNGVLTDLWRTVIQSTEGANYFNENEIKWKFIPEYTPWMGGAYERIIGITKAAFKKTYGELTLTETEYQTAIAEVEAVVNNRPLTYVEKDIESPVLTPNHFLRVVYPAIAVSFDEQPDQQCRKPEETITRRTVVKLWKEAEVRLNHFWKLWSEHYLLSLRESVPLTQRGQNSRAEPKIGDLVLMVDPTQRRGFWQMAIINQLRRSENDGLVRSAQVRLPTGRTLVRPIVKLAPFEVQDEDIDRDSICDQLRAFSSPGEGASADEEDSEVGGTTVMLCFAGQRFNWEPSS